MNIAYQALTTFNVVFPALHPYSAVSSHPSTRTASATCASWSSALFYPGFSVLIIWLPINPHRFVGDLVFFSLFFGFHSGAFVSLITPCLVAVAGGHTHDLGAMLGTYFAVAAIASLTGLPIQGFISSGVDLMKLMVFSGMTVLAGSGALSGALVLTQRMKAAQRTHHDAQHS